MFSICISSPNYRWKEYVACKPVEKYKVEKTGLIRIKNRRTAILFTIPEFKSVVKTSQKI
jgi:hypothetical protein